MSKHITFISKTQHYLKVKKPLLERQRRARINKCLDALKTLIAEFQQDDAIMRMDKAEMLESTIAFMRATTKPIASTATMTPMDSFRNGYMNAVNEVSRVLASTSGMSVAVGKSVMTHLGCEFNRLLQCSLGPADSTKVSAKQPIDVSYSAPPMSPASSGYHSDCDESPLPMPVEKCSIAVWRPW